MSLLHSRSLYKLYLSIFGLFLFSIIAAYPGGITYDSYLIFSQSLGEDYKFHNSPIVAFTWHCLNYLSMGPFIMLLLAQAMLWSAVSIFTYGWYKKHGYTRELWCFILLPLLPALLKTCEFIWKDVLFALSYLLLASVFSYYILHKKKPGIITRLILLIILFWGTACKFQAMYIAPIFIFWYLLVCFDFSKKLLLALTLILSMLMTTGIKNTNSFLANDYDEISRTGWQEIKFFDLVYISLKQDKVLLPHYLKQDPNFDFKQFQNKFVSSTIFNTMYGGKSPMTFTSDPIKQKEIMDAWDSAVIAYPFTYLQGRLYRISRLLTRFIDQTPSMLYNDGEMINKMKAYYHPEYSNNFLNKLIDIYTKLFFWVTMFALCLPFSIYYLYIGSR